MRICAKRKLVSSECVLLHQNRTNSILYMLYTLMRLYTLRLKLSCHKEVRVVRTSNKKQSNIHTYHHVWMQLYNIFIVHTTCSELADVVVRYNSWCAKFVLDGRPCCQSKPMRPGVGAPGRHHYKKSAAVDNRPIITRFKRSPSWTLRI